MIKNTRKVIRILTVKQRKQAVILAFLMLIGGILESVSISMILPLISTIMSNDSWNESWYSRIICNLFNTKSKTSYIGIMLIILIGVFIFKNIFLIFEYYVQYSFVTTNRFYLQKSLLKEYVSKPYDYYLNVNSGEIVRVITSDTNQAFSLLQNILMIYTEGFVCVILGITITIMSPLISIVLILTLVVEFLVISWCIKPIMKRIGDRQRKENALSYKWLLQTINGIKSIKVTEKEEFFCNAYNLHTKKVVDAEKKYLTLTNLPRLLIEAVTVSAVLLLMLVLILTGTDIVDIIPKLSAFVVAAIRLLPSVNRISASINGMSFMEGGLDNIISVLIETNLQQEPQWIESKALKENIEKSKLSLNESIEMKNISFAYKDTVKKILDHANLKIKVGESVGIVGTSGAGKTTTVDLLLGLLKPQGGMICVDGLDISENMHRWRSELAYIPQNIFLLDGSIKENIAFGVEESNVDINMIWETLREAQLDQFVRSLPDGIETEIGEQGIRLSGGQKQRIGIARALYDKPDVLFFDEATSALDGETEEAVMDAINHLKGKITLIIIAHRLSTLENCDMIYRVEEGNIISEEKRL